MKIAINGQTLLTKEFKPTGPYVYTENLIKTLAKIDKENQYIIYLSDQYTREGEFEDLTLNNPNFEVKVVPKSLSWTQFDLLKQLLHDKPDVFFTAIHTLPFLSVFWLKNVAMIHGLEYSFSPVSKSFKKYTQAIPVWLTAFFAKKIVVPSESTKAAILKRFAFINAAKISVVPEGVNPIFERKSQQDVEKVRAKYALGNSRYLLFVSTVQPRKNAPNMINAFAQYIKENKIEDLKLIFAGKLGWLYEDSVNAPKKYNIEDKVKFLGAVPVQDLPILFSGATAHLNFSFEEGFGLPILEAMSCGVPCVVSDIPVYKELDMNNFIFVNPKDVTSMKNGIANLLSKSQSELDSLVSRGSLNVQRFSWESTAKQTLQLLTH